MEASVNSTSGAGGGPPPMPAAEKVPTKFDDAGDPPAPPPAVPPRTSRRHQRTSSEDWGRTYPIQQQPYYGYPPQQISYNPNVMNMSPKQQQQQNGAGGGGGPPMPLHPDRGNHHNRERSWSGNQVYAGYPPPAGVGVGPYPVSPNGSGGMQGMPPMGYSPSGHPLVPMLIDPGQQQQQLNGIPMIPQQPVGQYNGGGARRKRKNAGHRRVHSYSGVPSYGSAQNEFFAPPHPSSERGGPPLPPQGRNRTDFSPRNEFMKITSGLRASPHAPASPRPPMSPHQSSLRHVGSFPKPDDPMRVSFSPGGPNMDSSGHGGIPMRGVYGMPGMEGSSGRGTIDQIDPSLTGSGEAVFLAQKGPGGGKHKRSSRKMHMRQRSAQLFMEDIKGTEQLPACRDLVFLLLFLFHILWIVYLGKTYGNDSMEFHSDFETDASVTIIYRNFVYVACLSGVFAVTASGLTLFLMTMVAKKIVQIALILTISLSFCWGTIGIGLSPKKVVPATGIIALMLSVAYAFIVWDRIPFAAANLNAALHGIRANPGAVVVAFFFQLLSLAYSIYYMYVVLGVYDAMIAGDLELTHRWKVAMYVGLGVSYYWTFHVFLNIVQVTVAGVIGSWWFTEEGDILNRREHLNRAFFRSCFYAFGSICFGSLFVGPVRLLRQVAAFGRPNEEGHSLLCLHECLHCIQTCVTRFVDALTDRFSPWAFTYVGLYGYGLLDAGHHATDLFEKRGWSTIVTDDLVPNVLLLTSLVIGGITGCFADLIEHTETLSFSSLNEPMATAFAVGLVGGLVVTSVLFGIIGSSVNAVIVCFAASPVDFERNHPELSQEMRTAWREVWPGCMDVVDLRVAAATYQTGSNGTAASETTPFLM